MKHEEGQFKGCTGSNLYYQYWLPSEKCKAILLVVHGLAEHSGRYHNLVNYFVPRGYGVYAFDQRGHGKSDGLRGYVNKFSDFVNDLHCFLGVVRSRHPDTKILIFGHSVGGTVAAAYATLHQDGLDGLILSGASLSTPSDVSAGLILLARLLSYLMPKTSLYAIDAEGISRNRDVVVAYVNDPMVYRGKIRARLGVELIKAMAMVRQGMPKIRLPLLIMHGTSDRLSEPKGSELLFDKAGSIDKTLKMYDGFYHEIFNETERERVFADMEAWLSERV
jgi:alpha-beta hydrolase superfamily lysophospholipase